MYLSTCIGFAFHTQYSPLVGTLLQLVAKTSLMCLHESAVSDFTFPSDGSILSHYILHLTHMAILLLIAYW